MAVKKPPSPSRSSSASRRRSRIAGRSDARARANPHPETLYVARFTAPEFTCLCPITGQPDFAHLVIDYAPRDWLLESKSLKLLSRELPQLRRLPRGRDHRHRQARRRADRARLAQRSAAIGIRAAASPSTCSGNTARRPTACGCRTRASRPIAGGADSGASPGDRSRSAP